MKKILFVFLLSALFYPAIAQTNEKLVIHFDLDKSELTSQAINSLDSFINVIDKREIISVNIEGHCDSKGSNAYNDVLSLKRVNTVKAYLQSKKNNIEALVSKGYGENRLLNADATEFESLQNRRVEINVTLKPPVEIKEEISAETKKETKSLTEILEDSTIKKGDVISIPNLEFYNHSDILLPRSMPTLQELYDVLIKNPKMKISIEGHICCVVYNKNLTLEQQESYGISVIRAKMIYDYLIKNNIEPVRISYKAFGNSHPIFPIPEKSEEERIANRRVEIRILDK